MWGLVTAAGAVLATLLGGALVLFYQRRMRRARLQRARDLLHRRREWLEAEFVSRASESGRPRSLVWENCEFEDAVALARDRHSGQLRALVGVTITFTPSDDHGLEVPDAELSHRAATAVFRFDGAEWTTDGRAIFNLNPAETIRRYGHELEVVE